jgi:hypothetical protein
MTQQSDKSPYARGDIELPQFKGHNGEWGMANEPPNAPWSAPAAPNGKRSDDGPTPFLTDEQVAARVRGVAVDLRDREPALVRELGRDWPHP